MQGSQRGSTRATRVNRSKRESKESVRVEGSWRESKGVAESGRDRERRSLRGVVVGSWLFNSGAAVRIGSDTFAGNRAE